MKAWDPSCVQHAAGARVHPCSLPSAIYFPCTFLRLLYTHTFLFFFSSKKAQGTAGPGDGNLSDAGVRHTLLIPRGDIICAICGRLQGSCRGVSLGTLAGRGPCLGTAPPPPARSGPAGPPFSPSTIFETAGIQSKHATALLSPF